MKLSERMRQAPDGSPITGMERWWHKRLCVFADQVAELEAENERLRDAFAVLKDRNEELEAELINEQYIRDNINA